MASARRIGLLGPDTSTRGELRAALLRLGHKPEVLEGLHQLPEAGKESTVDLVALCPGDDLEAGRRLSAEAHRRANVPILLVVPENIADRLDASLEIDDFILVPWHAVELGARIRVLTSDSEAPTEKGESHLIVAEALRIDPENYLVLLHDQPVELTLKEFELLRHLATHRGRVFTREALVSSVWGYDYFGGTRTVDIHIRRLRLKLGEVGEHFIETVRGVGYRFRR